MREMLNRKILINKKRIISKEIDKEVIFLDKQQKALYELNKTASFIFSKANGRKTIDEIIQEISLKYEIERKKAEKDTMEFIQDGVNKKIFTLQ